ncbi:hypothetical protein [Candidatus Rhodoluna planktonica]|nr:hypothetical protein [Candidatus Rhodoluna planktonica]
MSLKEQLLFRPHASYRKLQKPDKINSTRMKVAKASALGIAVVAAVVSFQSLSMQSSLRGSSNASSAPIDTADDCVADPQLTSTQIRELVSGGDQIGGLVSALAEVSCGDSVVAYRMLINAAVEPPEIVRVDQQALADPNLN